MPGRWRVPTPSATWDRSPAAMPCACPSRSIRSPRSSWMRVSRPSVAASPSPAVGADRDRQGHDPEDALKVSNQDIADYLDGLPPEKMHCSVMGREALQAAVATSGARRGATTTRRRPGVQALRGGRGAHRGHHPRQRSLLGGGGHDYTKAGGGCSACHEGIEEILTWVLTEQGRTFDPSGAAPAAPQRRKLGTLERVRRIEGASKRPGQTYNATAVTWSWWRSTARTSTST